MKTLSWKPKRSGTVYCSPACGSNCTRKAFEEANAHAEMLCVRMGPGWTPRVWENMGWHWSVISPCKRIKIHPNIYWKTGKIESYTAFLGEPGSGGTWAEHGRTPHAAMRNVIRVGKADLAKMNAKLVGL